MDFGVGAEDVGDDSGAVFVGIDLGEEPFCKQHKKCQLCAEKSLVEVEYENLFLRVGLVIGFLLQLLLWWQRLHSNDWLPLVSGH